MESDKQSLASDSSTTTRATGWVVALVLFMFLARIGHGLLFSISGPTLLFIADNVNADITQVSAVYSGRSLGVLLGSVIFSAIANRFPNLKPLLTLGVGFTVMGITVYATPFLTSLAGLTVMTTLGGLVFGYTDAGCQSVYLKFWGEEASRPYIQLTHFGFSVGAFLAPILAKPFLEMANEESETETNCPNVEEVSTTAMYTISPINSTVTGTDTDYFNPINWCYIIIGTYIVITSATLFVLTVLNAEDKIQTQNDESTESRKEEPVKDVWVLFLFALCYYFCCETMETVFASYVYSIALCSELNFSVSDASLLNSLFWAGFGISRGTAVLHSSYFEPTTIITYDLLGTTTSLVMMSIFGENITLLMWITTFFHGFCCATLYSCGVSWTSQVTNVSGTYMFLFAFGNSIGDMTMLPAAGALFDQDPFSVIYLLAGLSIANCIFFIIMNIIKAKHRSTYSELNDTEKKIEETTTTRF